MSVSFDCRPRQFDDGSIDLLAQRFDKMEHCDCNIARYDVGICRARTNIGETHRPRPPLLSLQTRVCDSQVCTIAIARFQRACWRTSSTVVAFIYLRRNNKLIIVTIKLNSDWDKLKLTNKVSVTSRTFSIFLSSHLYAFK